MTPQEAAELILIKAAAEDRKAAIRECVTWLTQNHQKYKPEFLAGYMADDLIEEMGD